MSGAGPDAASADEVGFATIPEAIAELAAGRLLIVVDDADRENEGDLVGIADAITADQVNFMAMHGRGLICTPLTGEILDRLRIPPMVADNTDTHETAFCVAVDARSTRTGTTAADRADTIRALVDPASTPESFRRPGHTFPLRYRDGGVLRRAGHTEASVDLAVLAGHAPGAVICEIMGDDGTMSRLPELRTFAAEHGLKIATIADLIKYRRRSERLIERIADRPVATEWGEFRCVVYRSGLDDVEHVAFVRGDVEAAEDVLVRVHSECLTGDVFGSLRCDCGTQLREALRRIAEEDCGVLLYFRGHEGRGIGLMHKLAAYTLQDAGRDTVEANLDLGFAADQRDYGIGAQVLADLGVTTMRLLTNNPNKRAGIDGYGLTIVDRVPLQVGEHPENLTYLKTKAEKLGHLLDGLDAAVAGDVPTTGE